MQDYEYMYEVCLCSVFGRLITYGKHCLADTNWWAGREPVCVHDLMKLGRKRTQGHTSVLATFSVNCTDTHWWALSSACHQTNSLLACGRKQCPILSSYLDTFTYLPTRDSIKASFGPNYLVTVNKKDNGPFWIYLCCKRKVILIPSKVWNTSKSSVGRYESGAPNHVSHLQWLISTTALKSSWFYLCPLPYIQYSNYQLNQYCSCLNVKWSGNFKCVHCILVFCFSLLNLRGSRQKKLLFGTVE